MVRIVKIERNDGRFSLKNMVKKSENKVVVKKDINKSITDFLNVEYLNYSLATVGDRAIPSICDGFKPGARKIVHAMFEGSLKMDQHQSCLPLLVTQ